MRYVRAYTLASTGQLVNVSEQEHPFDTFAITVAESPGSLELHELGLAEHFDPIDLQGARCSPSRHLFLRMEHVADLPPSILGAARFRAMVGREAEVPVFHDVPTTIEGIKSLARAKGPAAIPERVANWLEFMGALSGDEMDAAGLPRLTVTRAAEFDAMRRARDPSVGSRLETFKRRIRERAMLRKASR